MVQFPKRKETDEQAKQRAEEITLHNSIYGCNEQGQPVDEKGEPLKNLSKKEWDVFKAFRR